MMLNKRRKTKLLLLLLNRKQLNKPHSMPKRVKVRKRESRESLRERKERERSKSSKNKRLCTPEKILKTERRSRSLQQLMGTTN